VARRQEGQLHTSVEQERTAADEEGIGSLAYKTCERGIGLVTGTDVNDPHLQRRGASGHFELPHSSLGICPVRVEEHEDASCPGH
jgi:hypothetical protein